ncbi:zf-CCHC domain-containing protein [Tanacetum coccineum]|uniref:Zf-CCHC domain-containing protein n=1 Tax=Tanacetum coccineum TaxID=301880 RepID=A0ABQ5GHX5_9ASTR
MLSHLLGWIHHNRAWIQVVPFEEQSDDLKKKLAKNNEAKMVLYNALTKKEYERIFMCKTAKDIWQSLLITHQGNSYVKDNKIDLLVQQYEQFTILKEESIDSGFARFNTIITSLKALDEGFSSKNYFRKFLRDLHPKWRAKVTAIEESKDLSSLALDELIRNLKIHKVVMEKDSKIYKGKKEKVKSIALKAKKESSDDETSTSRSDDEEYAMAVRNFKKFFRRNGKFVRQPREEKKSFRQRDEKKGKSDQKCFRCGDPNHLIGDCPKPSRNKDQKAFIGGSWSDSENDAEDKTNDETCLMAQSSNEVTLNSSYYSDNASSLDNDSMQIEYDSLCEISLKIINKNKILKTKRDLLEKEILELNEKIKKLERSKEIEIACKSCEELKSENAKLKETQVKFVKFDKSANSLREMLNNQKSPSCKIGLGFNDSKASISRTKNISFIGSSAKKATDGSTIKVHGSTLLGSIKQMEDEIFFNQSKYIKELLKKLGLEDSKLTKTPMSTEISSLRTMKSTPWIALNIENPKTTHLEAIKRIFRYKSCTYSVMSDSDESGVTYTEISSTFEELLDIGSPGVVPSPDYILGPEEPQSPPPLDVVPESVYPEYMPQEDEVFPAEEQPLPAAASPTAQSPDYVPESDPEADPEEDDDEDPEEDPVDYPADGGDDGDDEDESSEDDEDDDMDIKADDDEEEEDHPAPADSAVVALPATDQAPSAEEKEPFETRPHLRRRHSHLRLTKVARLLAISTLPSSPLSPWSSPLPQIPSPPLPQIPSPPLPVPVLSLSPPASPVRLLGYRAYMIRLRAEAASTSHSLPLPPPIILSHTRPDAPSLGLPPLHLLSTDHRDDRPEVTLPPRKRLGIALGPRYEIGESSSAAAARPARGLRADYGFVATLDREIKRDLERDVGYGITDSWDEIVEAMQGTPVVTDIVELSQRMTEFETRVRRDTDEVYTRLDDEQSGQHLLAGRFNMLFRNRRAHARTARVIETEARMSREA